MPNSTPWLPQLTKDGSFTFFSAEFGESFHSTEGAKEEAVEKINKLVSDALIKKKARIATKISKAAKERRIESKKRKSDLKSGRKKFRPGQND